MARVAPQRQTKKCNNNNKHNIEAAAAKRTSRLYSYLIC
jgi:hypothetical protein